MKLYYAPGACSQAPHLILHETGLAHEGVKVDLKAKKLQDGGDYLAINPKGAVPALEFDNGEVLTENAAILQYLGDRASDDRLLPPAGNLRRYRVLEWLNYIATELHKGYGPLWNPQSSEETKQATRDLLAKKFDYVAGQLGDGPYLMGQDFSIADAYLFVILRWTYIHDIDLGRWPALQSFVRQVSSRPAVQQTLRAEGLAEGTSAG